MNNLTKDALIGIAALALIIIGIVWWAATHPPAPAAPGGAATTTPGTADTGEIEQSGDTYTIDVKYPTSTPLAQSASPEADAAALALMKSSITDSVIPGFMQSVSDNEQTVAQFQAQGQEVPASFTNLTLDGNYQMYQSAHTVTYVFQFYEFTGGAHGNGTYETFTFDAKTGARLSLSDLFAPGTHYPTELSQIARAKLPAQIAAAEQVDVSQVDMDMVDEGTTADPNNFQYFYLDGSNLVIIFPPYAVGPYVLGTVELTLPISQVQSFNQAYAP